MGKRESGPLPAAAQKHSHLPLPCPPPPRLHAGQRLGAPGARLHVPSRAEKEAISRRKQMEERWRAEVAGPGKGAKLGCNYVRLLH